MILKSALRYSVHNSSNIICIQTIYTLMTIEDRSLKLKAQNAPHRNGDSYKMNEQTEYNLCIRIVIRVIATTAGVQKWRVLRTYDESALLQSSPATLKVYVVPPTESLHYNTRWLLSAAAYSLVNLNAK